MGGDDVSTNGQLCLDGVLGKHEARYKWFLTMLRLRLKDLALSRPDRIVSADDAHQLLATLNLPPEADTRFMGALWKSGEWEHAGFAKSVRCQNHHRFLSRWRLKS